MNMYDCKCSGVGRQMEIPPSQRGPQKGALLGKLADVYKEEVVQRPSITLLSPRVIHSCMEVKAYPP